MLKLSPAMRSQAAPGDALLQLLEGLPLEGREKSFKMTGANLLADRYLLGVHKSDITPARLFEICRRIGMPDCLLADMDTAAQDANAFHFGFEGAKTGGLYKVYLEFASRLRSAGSDPVLLHLAYKWHCNDSRAGTIARYVCHRSLLVQAVLRRLDGLYGGRSRAQSLAAAKEVIDAAARRIREPLMYLEVSEAGNPRASFDLKLHDAGMRVRDIGASLDAARKHYSIPERQFEALVERVADAKLGHLSGGINREGRDFLTVYYAEDDQ